MTSPSRQAMELSTALGYSVVAMTNALFLTGPDLDEKIALRTFDVRQGSMWRSADGTYENDDPWMVARNQLNWLFAERVHGVLCTDHPDLDAGFCTTSKRPDVQLRRIVDGSARIVASLSPDETGRLRLKVGALEFRPVPWNVDRCVAIMAGVMRGPVQVPDLRPDAPRP